MQVENTKIPAMADGAGPILDPDRYLSPDRRRVYWTHPVTGERMRFVELTAQDAAALALIHEDDLAFIQCKGLAIEQVSKRLNAGEKATPADEALLNEYDRHFSPFIISTLARIAELPAMPAELMRNMIRGLAMEDLVGLWSSVQPLIVSQAEVLRIKKSPGPSGESSPPTNDAATSGTSSGSAPTPL